MKFITRESRMGRCLGKRFIKRKFLWFPVEICGEVRWLEYANVRYRVVFSRDTNVDYVWFKDSFVD